MTGPAARDVLGSAALDRLTAGLTVVDEQERLDPDGFDALVARIAGGLRERGVTAGGAVLWRRPNDAIALALYRACWRLGATAAPVHHQGGEALVDAARAALRPAVAFVDEDPPLGPPVTGSADERTDRAAAASDDVAEPTPGAAPSTVLFTSGSSGTPKGVMHSADAWLYKARLMVREHGLGPDDTVLMPAPLAHVSGLLNGLLVPGAAGMTTVLMGRWDPEVALTLIERERITFMVGPPTFFVALMDAPGFDTRRVASLRLISSGGAGVTDAFRERAERELGARVKNAYGSTEAPTVLCDGRPVGDARLRVDEASGELQVRGPELLDRYLDPADTAAAFTADGWFRTGDRAAVQPDGRLAVLGRLADTIIRGGENIPTAHVEEILERHPAVRQAAVVGYPDRVMGERVAAFVVTDEPLNVASGRDWFAACGAARFMAPERVENVPSLPTLASGKVDRAALRARIRTV